MKYSKESIILFLLFIFLIISPREISHSKNIEIDITNNYMYLINSIDQNLEECKAIVLDIKNYK